MQLKTMSIALCKPAFTRASAVLIILCAFASPASGQWIKTNGPFGTFASEITAFRDTIFLMSGLDLFRGETPDGLWQSIPNSSNGIQTMHVAGDRIYAGSAFGIYLSLDGGRSWHTQLSAFASDIQSISGQDSFLLATGGSYMYMTRNAGKTWTNIMTTSSGFQRFLVIDTIAIFCAPAGVEQCGLGAILAIQTEGIL